MYSQQTEDSLKALLGGLSLGSQALEYYNFFVASGASPGDFASVEKASYDVLRSLRDDLNALINAVEADNPNLAPNFEESDYGDWQARIKDGNEIDEGKQSLRGTSTTLEGAVAYIQRSQFLMEYGFIVEAFDEDDNLYYEIWADDDTQIT
jgi:hypothetical protein